MKKSYPYQALFLLITLLPLLTTTAYKQSIPKKPGIVLTPESIYYNGPLASASTPLIGAYLNTLFAKTGYEALGAFAGTTSSAAYTVVVQTDGKSILAGYSLVSGTAHYSLARLNPNGSLDNTFNIASNTPGIVILPLFIGSTSDTATALQLQPDGKILIAGFSTVGGSSHYSIARLYANGSLDTSFNPTGVLPGTFIVEQFTTSTEDRITAMQLQADGKIVVAGFSHIAQDLYSVARLNSDGSLDLSFNPNEPLPGTLILPMFPDSSNDRAHALLLQPDGKMILAGFSNTTQLCYSIARLNNDGSLDDTFNAIP